MSPPTPADEKKIYLLEIAVSLVILAFWGVLVGTGTFPDEGVWHWLMLALGPVVAVQIGYAGWRYLWPREKSSRP